MAAAAYVLLQEIRLTAALTSLSRPQVWTLREKLLKLGARVVPTVRRVAMCSSKRLNGLFSYQYCLEK